MSPKSPEILAHTPEIISPENLQKAREALAKRWGMTLDQIPDDSRILKLFDKSLDDLSSIMKGQQNPLEKARILKEKIASIDVAEAADKARELGADGKKLLASEALEQSAGAAKAATETLKTEGVAHGKEAVAAIGALASARSIDDATKGIDGLTKVIDSTEKMLSGVMDNIKNIFSSLWKALGLDKLFKSIGGLFGFGGENPSGEAKKEEEPKKDTAVVDTVKKATKGLETPEGRKEFIEKISGSLGDKISKTYFGGEKLSEPQMKKLYDILNNSLNTESIIKVYERFNKGEIQIGELFDAIINTAGTYPATVMWELSFSGIIPLWAITQHVVMKPAGNLIKLTFDGLGLPVTGISLENFGSMLEKKAQGGDNHALDMARIQLYGVNSVLFRTIGEVLGTAVAGGIMLTNTTTGTDGFRNMKLSYLKDYSNLEKEFGRIENILGRGMGYTDKVGAFSHMLGGIKDLRTNALVMDAVAKNTINGKLDHQKIIDTIDDLVSQNPELGHINTQALKTSINNENTFREALKNLIKGPSSTAGWKDSMERLIAKYAGGRTGEALKYLEHIDSVKKWQQSLIGDVGTLSEKLKRLKLSYESLKLARSGDTVVLHMENMDDISKFRSFLSTIPGGIKALSEVIPAASLAISLGSVAWDARDKKEGITGESLMDVLKTAVIPAYGTWGIIRDKTVNFGKMIADGEMPEFSDMALTGVVGGVFVYEVTRVGSGIKDIFSGNIAKGASKLTYMHDIGRGFGQVVRGVRNITALATKPAIRPEFAKSVANIAAKMPKKGRIAIAGLLLAGVAGGVAYAMGEDSPEQIQGKYKKEGLIDDTGVPTQKLQGLFYKKTLSERKEILDSLFILFHKSADNLPKTHYEEGIYSLIDYKGKSEILDSEFRRVLQSFGIDIQFVS